MLANVIKTSIYKIEPNAFAKDQIKMKQGCNLRNV